MNIIRVNEHPPVLRETAAAGASWDDAMKKYTGMIETREREEAEMREKKTSGPKRWDNTIGDFVYEEGL